jgi:predicted CoA-substrate-specific enzyme activase
MSAVRLGIDMGSVSTKVAVLRDGAILKTFYRRHLGRPAETLALILSRIPSWTGYVFSFTGSASRLAAEAAGIEPVNEVVALAEAISRFHPGLRSVIEMGGQDSKLLLFRPDGRGSVFDDFAMNSICAAGTGSFLDQQAARLGLDPSVMGELALRCERPPRVAGRCSVFAKSDMIHLQQIGAPPEDIVAGLCLAVARNFKSTIAGGKEFAAPVGFVGGVAANAGMVRAFGEVLAGSCGGLTVPRHFGTLTAAGCALAAKPDQAAAPSESFLDDLGRLNDSRVHSRTHPPLTRHAAPAPALEPGRLEPGAPVYLGIDVGSISTNVVALDESGALVAREYLMTAGRPLEAVKKGLGLVASTVGPGTAVLGVGVTGSGRYMTGDFVGADVIRNEITAQARAAVAWDPLVDTVFEIGGQDSKYISISDGRVVDFEMNKVCAAGTGSFLEEQAERLGLSIREFGPLALESHSPAALGERCTVFMDSDVVAHQAAGTSVEDMVGGLSYSIVQNYLHRVVGGRRIGSRILFQGGTAHNKGVVAAFGAVLGRDVSVPDHHDVTGAIGAALLAKEEKAGGPSAFRGFGTSTQSYTQDSFTCSHCSNNCEIHRVLLEGGRQLLYGGRCERFETARSSPVTPGRNWFPQREEILLDGWVQPGPGTGRTRVGMPRALWFWELFPYFRTFFEAMGCDVVLSSPSSSTTVHRGVENTASETCFPVKLAHGHVIDLLENGAIDMLFLPSVTRAAAHPGYRESHSCPYVQGSPWIIDAGLGLTPGRMKVLNPVVDLSADMRRITDALSAVCAGTGLDPSLVRPAVEAATRAQERFEHRLSEAGALALSELGEEGRALVIVSRPYNGCDPMVSGDLAAKLARTGANVMPAEYLDLPLEAAAAIHSNMYWHYGQKILASALAIREDPRLNGVYLTNFGCGPDSFTGHFFEAVMDGKPFLMIETDEHAADAGMITRCEAFLDSIAGRGADGSGSFDGTFELDAPVLEGRTIWVPHLGDGTRLIAASARRRGISACPMPQTDAESVALGRSVTSGRECYPAIITSGNMLKVLRDGDPSKTAFFMGTASGPCRFGQYCTYHRMILEKAGYGDVPVVTASSRDSYTSVSGLTGPGFQLDLLRSAVAADILLRAVSRIRPYARDREAVGRAYSDSLDIIEEAIEKGSSAVSAMTRAARLFEPLALEGLPKPRILVFGEIYVRNDPYANAWTADRIEELGGEVIPTPLSEWFEFVNHCFVRRSKASSSLAGVAKGSLKGALIHHVKRSLEKPFHHILRDRPEPTSQEILDAAGPYMRENIGGEAILCIGAPVAMARRGLIDGAVNVLPFTCLPGTVVAAVSKRIRRDLPDLPWLNLAFDGQEDTDNSSRLEAFMFQVLQRRTGRPGGSPVEALSGCRSVPADG